MSSHLDAPRSLLVGAFAAGTQALLAQSLLLREALLLYGGNEIAVGVFLGWWLLGIVAGALILRRFEELAERLTVPLLLVQGALPLVAVALARLARGLAGVPAYEPFPLMQLLVWSAPVAVPVSLTTGALVPSLAARGRKLGVRVTTVYVAESLGSLAGGVGATLLLAGGVEPASLVLGCVPIGAAGAFLLIAGRRRLVLAAAAAALIAGLPWLGPELGDRLRRQHLSTVLPGASLLDHAETASASLMLAELRGQQVLLLDGQVLAAFPDPARVQRVAGVMAALTGGPRKVLVVGAGAADLLPGTLSFGALEQIVWVVADPGFRDFALRHLPLIASDDRVEIVVGDPIRRLATLRDLGPFDAVWLMVDTPLRRSDDRFVARETFRALGELAPDGVLAVPVRSAENYVGPRLRLAVGTVVAGVGEAFDTVRLLPGEDGLVLGTGFRAPAEREKNPPRRRAGRRAAAGQGGEPASLDFDAARLYRLYLAMEPQPARIPAEGFASLLEDRRLALADSLVASLRRDPKVRASELDRPLALYHNLLVRAEQESDDLARLLEALRQTGGVLWVPLAVLALFVLGRVTARREPADTQRGAAAALLAAGGALGMGLDLLLLHLYQGRFGTLYLEVGWLFGLWMGGLALGGSLGRRLCLPSAAAASSSPAPGGSPCAVGLAATLGLAALAGSIAGLGSGVLPGRLAGGLAFVVAGALSGAVVPAAEALLAASGVVGARAGIGIEAADHLGGAVCALGLGVLGIPILGLAHAALLVAGLAVFGAVVLGVARIRERGALPRSVEVRLRRAAVYESFPYRRAILVLMAAAVAAVLGRVAVDRVLLGPRIHLEPTELADAGLAAPWREHPDPVVHYRSKGEEDRKPATGGRPADLALASRAAAPRVQGYGGPVNLLVTLDGEGRIRRVAFLEHRETPSYVEDIESFFKSLEGKSVLVPFRVRPRTADFSSRPAEQREPEAGVQPIDGLTGATVTSRAVVRALEGTGQRLAGPVFGRTYAGERGPGGTSILEPRLVYLVASFVLLLPVFLCGGRRLRRAWLLIHAAVGGLWLGVQLSTVQVLSWLRFEPDLSLSRWTGLLGLAILLAVLAGPLYCGYLCPAGALQELLGLAGRARRLPADLDRAARFVKYVILAVVVVGTLGLGSDAVLGVDLLREVWTANRSGWGTALLVLVGLGCLVTVRFGCRYLCPTGAFLNLLSKVAPFARRLPAKRYTACDLGVRGLPDVDCLQCNRCLVGEEAAPSPGWRVRAFVGLLVAVLLAYALTVADAARVETAAPSVEPRVRPVDTVLLKMKMDAGRLSDRPAEYWHVVRE